MKHFLIVVVLIVASTFAIHAGLTSIHLFPIEASAQAAYPDQLFGFYVWATAFVFSLIIVPLVYSLILFRRRKGDTTEGQNFKGNSTLEVIWTIIPLIFVIGLAYVGAQNLADERRVDPSAMVVKVVTGQWYWQFQYPDYGISTTDLYLPLDKQVDLQMTSKDVIHSFFVPEFRVKQDILPGRTVDLRVTPTVIGNYKVECSQLCGSNHSYMVTGVDVVTQQNFDAWVASQKANAAQNPTLLGEQLAGQYGCTVCHSTDGTTKIGPTWLHLYELRVPLSDGTTVMADETYLTNSISNPNLQIVKGFSPNVMPGTFGQTLDKNQIATLVAYIESLK